MSNGHYLYCALSPRSVEELDENAVPWQDLGTGFTEIGFATNTPVRFVYQCTVTETGLVIEALGDTDGDGKRILFVSSESTGPCVVGPADAALPLSLGTRADTKD